jgi:hypothetical protein
MEEVWGTKHRGASAVDGQKITSSIKNNQLVHTQVNELNKIIAEGPLVGPGTPCHISVGTSSVGVEVGAPAVQGFVEVVLKCFFRASTEYSVSCHTGRQQ